MVPVLMLELDMPPTFMFPATDHICFQKKDRGQKERKTERDRENSKRDRETVRLMKVIYMKVFLGDSNRQPQSSRENLERYP